MFATTGLLLLLLLLLLPLSLLSSLCTAMMVLSGAGQYTTYQITAALNELTATAYGNSHSKHPSSARATAEVAAARQRVLQHFNADPEEYNVIFTK